MNPFQHPISDAETVFEQAGHAAAVLYL